ncbi:MAG: CHRD domain-containing protein [Proteobacteria bacterium]|nr:MAG: CHRD domain-containing protein [Pseudomonadota bacterium]
MSAHLRKLGMALAITLTGSVLALGTASAVDVKLTLTGDQEVPPVNSPAVANGTIAINDNAAVSGSIVTTGIKATSAHIHEAPAGKNGPVIVPLEKKSDREFVVPAGTKLSEAQYKAFKAGDLYVNVHSDAHKDGEIRAQLTP